MVYGVVEIVTEGCSMSLKLSILAICFSFPGRHVVHQAVNNRPFRCQPRVLDHAVFWPDSVPVPSRLIQPTGSPGCLRPARYQYRLHVDDKSVLIGSRWRLT